MNRDWIIGLDIGGTKTAVVAGDARGNVLHREQFPSEPGRGFEDMFARITGAMGRVAGEMQSQPRAVSVSVGGPLDVLKGIVLSPPNLPGWTRVPLKDLLAARFRAPVYVEHDGNA
ncbi:MAG TPA: ROK family protein, partial [Bacteroidota bacterium]|nr:ROK family protein [Bacteroidota bacterium]